MVESNWYATATGSSRSASEGDSEKALLPEMVLTSSMQMVLSMGFGYMQVMEAYSIFGDDVDSMICYLLEMGGSGGSPAGRNRHKGKAAEWEAWRSTGGAILWYGQPSKASSMLTCSSSGRQGRYNKMLKIDSTSVYSISNMQVISWVAKW